MLINHSFQINLNGHSNQRLSIRQYSAKAFSKLKSRYQHSLTDGLLHKAVEIYKQNPLMVSAVAGFSLMSLIFVIFVYGFAGGKGGAASEQHALENESGRFPPGHHYTQARIQYELNVIALSIIEDRKWDQQHVVDFASGWNALDAAVKAELKQSVWFQTLENTLRNKTSATAGDSRTKLLADLAADIGLPNSPSEPATATRIAPNVKNPAPVAKAQEPPMPAPQTQPAPAPVAVVEPQTPQSQTLVAQNTSPPAAIPLPVREPTAPAAVDTQPSVSQATVSSPAGTPLKLPQQFAPQIAVAAPNSVTPNRVNRVIRTDSPLLSDNPKNLAGSQNNPASSPQASLTPAAANKVEPKSRLISESELQKITAEFVNSYEKGNINTFTALFAAKAVSNDETDLNAIKEEYASLFATTSDRRMIIGDLKWDFANNTAIGEGPMEVAVKSKGADNAQRYSGKIQIVVEKQADDVQITKLYHALQ